MKFLVDNQLPVALAHFLSSQGHDAQHVLDIHMDEAEDRDIWNYSISESRVVISEDFLHLANQVGTAGQFVWVRLGNCQKRVLLDAFERTLPAIVTGVEQGHRVIEMR